MEEFKNDEKIQNSQNNLFESKLKTLLKTKLR